jgi:undecaprenyl-diphosphatase
MRALLYTAAVATGLTILCIIVVDEPVARWLATRDAWPAMWAQILRVLEYPLGIEPYKWIGVYVMVAGALASLLVPRLRFMASAWVLVALVHLIGRNVMMYVKPLTGRLRPSQWTSFGGDAWFRDGYGFSFPSGHVILFASIILPLVLLYPRLRPLLALVAFAMIARVVVNAHFLSDVFGGLAVTAAATWSCARFVRVALPSQIRPPSLQ